MDILIDTIKDTYLIIPLLFIMYLVIEYFEKHQHTSNYEKYFNRFGPLFGAIVGIIPQCGISVMGSILFIDGKVTLGTLISIFIATSDEALPLLLAHPSMIESVILFVVYKIAIAIVVGYVVDLIFKQKRYQHQLIKNVDEHHHSSILDALIKTLRIYAYIFIINILLSLLIENIGEDVFSTVLMSHSLFQPILAAIFGLIPNCATSIALTQLYIHYSLSFASLIAGLMTNAGLGLIVLFQNKVDKKMIFLIIGILVISASLIGLPLQWFHLYG